MSSERAAKPSGSQGKEIRQTTSRRRVLAAGIAAPLVVGRHILGAGYQAPSDTLAIAAVGVGGMGKNYLAGCRGERVVALCDLDHQRAAHERPIAAGRNGLGPVDRAGAVSPLSFGLSSFQLATVVGFRLGHGG